MMWLSFYSSTPFWSIFLQVSFPQRCHKWKGFTLCGNKNFMVAKVSSIIMDSILSNLGLSVLHLPPIKLNLFSGFTNPFSLLVISTVPNG